MQGKSTHPECPKAIFTHRNIPTSVHTLTLLFKMPFVLLCDTEMSATVILRVCYWYFVQWRTLNSTPQHSDRRGSAAMWFSSCAENASSLLITGNHLHLILAQHLPKLPAPIQEETQITAGFPLQTESGCSAGTKTCQLCSFWPRFLRIYIYINSRAH